MAENTNRVRLDEGNLFIGCGGTGFEVVRRLKQQLLENAKDEKILSTVGFLVLDTVPFNKKDRTPLESSEYLDMSDGRISTRGLVGVDSILRKSGRDVLKDWWYDWPDPPDIKNGAGQRPPLGRLAFYASFRRIEKMINDKIGQINSYRDRIRQTTNVNAKYDINAYVISSLAGGTGCGTFIDVGILLNHLLMAGGGTQEPEVLAYLLGGHIFQKKNAIRAMMNTAGSFYEISYFYEGEARKVSYPEDIDLTVGVQGTDTINRIFKRIIFFDDVNEKGLIPENPDSMYETMSNSLFPLALGTAGAQIAEGLVNSFDPIDKDHLISSIGCRVIEFPEDDIKNYFSWKTGARILNDFFLQNPTEKEKSTHVNEAILQLHLDEEGLQRNEIQDRLLYGLNSGYDNYGLTIFPSTYKEQLPNYDNSDEAVLNAFISQNNDLLGKIRKHMESRIQTMLNEYDLSKIIEEKFKGKGLVAALSLLHHINSKMNSFINELTEEKNNLEKNTENVLENLKGELNKDVNRFLGVRKWRNYFFKIGIGDFNSYYENRFEVSKREVAIMFINEFKNKKITSLIKQYENLEGYIRDYVESVNSRINNWKINRNATLLKNPVVEEFLSVEEIEKIYDVTVDENLSITTTDKKFTLAPLLNAAKDSLIEAQSKKDVEAVFKSNAEYFNNWIENDLDFTSALQLIYPGKGSKFSERAKGKIKLAFTRMFDALSLWWNIDEAREKPTQFLAVFVGPKEEGGTSAGINKKWIDLIKNQIDTAGNNFGVNVNNIGIAQRPERYFIALAACSSIGLKALSRFEDYSRQLSTYFAERYNKKKKYSDYNPIFIDRAIESYTGAEIYKDIIRIPELIVNALGFGTLKSIGYLQNWVIAFTEKPNDIVNFNTYATNLKTKEGFLKGLGKENDEELLKELEEINYIYVFPHRTQTEDLREAIRYIDKADAVYKALDKEVDTVVIKFRRRGDPSLKEDTISKARKKVEEIKERVLSKDDPDVKRFWLVLSNELLNLKNKS